MSVEVVAPGLATTVQGAPRVGLRHLGVATSGALDPWSSALANLLVGNDPDAAALELTLTGPTLRFERPACIALCGGGFDMDIDGESLASSRPVRVPAGALLRIGRAHHGARGYLAVRGGFAIEPVLGSASTDLRGGFGGQRGGLLRIGDRLTMIAAEGVYDRPRMARWWIDEAPDDRPYEDVATIRVLAGRDATLPDDALYANPWTVAAASNRQGLRLDGPMLQRADASERVSEPVAPGTIQLPPDGRPIVLLADAQTHGGYPRIGHAIRADWPWLAQRRPGERLRFVPCSRDEAIAAVVAQRQRLHRLALAIRSRGDLDG